MKAVLSNRIYLEVTKEYREFLQKELTYTIPTYNPADPPIIIKNMSRIKDTIVTIPVGRTDLIPEGYEIVEKRVTKPVNFPEFKFTLRESQDKVYREVDDNCIINATVSWGKTFTALAIAAKLGQKTLVITHTIALRNQWEKEVKKVFGISPGIIGSGKFEMDAPIVIGNVQTLYRNKDLISKEFGTLILDEMHHCSATTFSRLVDSNRARYKIGLSGTIERKDGKHVVFRDYFGSKIYTPPKENSMEPVVNIIRSDVRFMDGGMAWANKVNKLTNDPEYIHLVAMLAAAYAAKGHKVLLVSDRVNFLHTCAELIGDSAVAITGRVTDLDERDRLADLINTGKKEVLCGTQAIFSEGISINALSCLILGTPVNNVPLLTQLIGRVIRKLDGKPTPIIADIHLIGRTATRQASSRIGHYMKEGYYITEVRP